MGQRLSILHAKFDSVRIQTANGAQRVSILTFEVEPSGGPRWGTFRIAIHHPEGKVEEWVAAKGEWHDILGQNRDTFTVVGGPAALPPKGSTLEVIEPAAPEQTAHTPR